jgi:hypothetical protein
MTYPPGGSRADKKRPFDGKGAQLKNIFPLIWMVVLKVYKIG